MICPHCNYDNIDGVDTCDACGQSLVDFDPSSGELADSITRHPISVLCPKPPITIDVSARVGEAVRIMVSNRIGCLLVVDGKQLVGIFTERDVLNRISPDLDSLTDQVSVHMTTALETVEVHDSIAYTLHAMDLGGYRHMPVVDAQRRPTGIISARDILRFLCVRFAHIRTKAG